jgi:predicted nucleotidyltransferase
MNQLNKLNLPRQTIKAIVKLILRYRHPEKIVIFGSRTNGSARLTSDIDIAIFGKDWSDADISLVKNDLEEYVKTPLKFDVLNFYTLTKESLKKAILQEGRVIYEKDKELYKDYVNALKRLSEALWEDLNKGSIVVDGTIQRFEFTFELAWKLARLVVEK